MKPETLYKIFLGIVIAVAVALIITAPIAAHAAELPTTDPATPCGLSAAEYDNLLSGTALQGIGFALEAGEKATGINGLFVCSICALESGWGTSHKARTQNNIGGVNGAHGYRNFVTRDACVTYMFDFLNRMYFDKGRTTVDSIAPVYCQTPVEDPGCHWKAEVSSILRKFVREIG